MQDPSTIPVPGSDVPVDGDVGLACDEAVDSAISAAGAYLLSIQEPDGVWCGELEGDTILESEYVLTMHFLGRTAESRVAKAAQTIRQQQLDEGGWAIYPGGPPEVSSSVKAYFVLKLLGDDPESPPMVRARRKILELGGVGACNSFTRIYLSIFGQYEWKKCPAVPPELILFPQWFPFNIYAMSSWSRAIVVPLSIIWAHKPRCEVPAHASIGELYRPDVQRPADVTKYTGRRTLWTHFFTATDRAVKLSDRLRLRPFRKMSIRRAEQWTLERLRMSDGLGAIFPPIINTIIALRCLDYPMDHPVLRQQIEELEKLTIEEHDTLRVQPCFSALWDTAQVLNALLHSGLDGDSEEARTAARWLLDREVRHVGDWAVKQKETGPGGWYFEYANEFYPDCDDTAEVLRALACVHFEDQAEDEARKAAMQRGLDWLLAMQNKDGGWAAFDKDCTRRFLEHVPFADHNAMLDPSCEDITGRVLEALAALDIPREHPAVKRAVAFLHDKQQADGSWYGRWGCNFIYGTWLAVCGLRHVGEDPRDERLQRAAAWLREVQNEDGGWGELPHSYDDPSMKGHGPSTAAQTAWALMTLFAVDDFESAAVRRGLAYLLREQKEDGSWYDEHWTGTGFPRVFYLRYHLYATQFPLSALAAYARHTAGVAAQHA